MNAWIAHVKKVASQTGLTYSDALKEASKTYRKGSASTTHPGRLDFTTKKGSKVFHEKGHYVRKGRKPYGGGLEEE